MVRLVFRNIFSSEFLRFCIVGFSNMAIDLGILNVLSYATGIYAGLGVVFLNIASFTVAVTNSYFWNKRWTFRHGSGMGAGEFSKFAAVNICGVVLNSGAVYIVTTFVGPLGGLHPQLWLNIAKGIALPLSTAWNFFGTKFLIFTPKLPHT